MAKKITSEQVKCFAGTVISGIKSALPAIELEAAQNAESLITPRIFNDGKNANEQSISYPGGKTERDGSYSKYHAKKRRERGAQTGYVDLQHTDQLFRSLAVIRGESPYFGIKKTQHGADKITNPELAEILEDMYRAPIFEASDNEEEKILSVAANSIADIVEDAISNCL